MHTKVRSVMDGDTHPSAMHCVLRKLTPPHQFSCPTRVGSCSKSKQHKKILHRSGSMWLQRGSDKPSSLGSCQLPEGWSLAQAHAKASGTAAVPTIANGIDKRSISVEH